MKKKIFKSNLINFLIVNNNLYLKVKNLKTINEKEINNAIFIYKYITLICFNNKIRYKMIIDLTNCEYNIINVYNNIRLFLNVLNLMKPISNHTVKFSILLFSNSIIKQFIDIVLNFYKPSRPIYLINNQEDIKILCS